MTDDRDGKAIDGGHRPRGGRPRVAAPMTSISTRIPPQAHDRLIQLANQQEVSVHEYLRRGILSWLR